MPVLPVRHVCRSPVEMSDAAEVDGCVAEDETAGKTAAEEDRE